MGQSYSNPSPSPQATDDAIEFYWRDDIREYDVTNLGSNPPKFGIFEEDIELTIERLRHCSSFDNRKDPSTLAAVIITVLINVVPIYFYVDWSITSNGKYLWTLAFVPIYLALNALLPMLLLKIGALLLRMSKTKRADEFRKVLEQLNNRNFSHRKIRADYDTESFRLTFRKNQN